MVLIYFTLNSKFNETSRLDNIGSSRNINLTGNCAAYKKSCLDLFYKLRYPNKKMIFRPPLKEIPKELYNAFTANGDMPLTKLWYFNDMFNDAESSNKNKKVPVDKKMFDNNIEKVKNWKPLGYQDTNFQHAFEAFKTQVKDKSLLIIGTINPWIEAIGYVYGSSKIVTLDYTRKYWHDKRLEWYHVNDYLELMIKKQLIEQIDNSATYSSIEHSGLGRFGDPLAPDGDLEAMQQTHCMIKPGGLFFVGDLHTSGTDIGELQFNAKRVWGNNRMKLLLKGWEILDHKFEVFKGEYTRNQYVLRKIGCQ